MNEQTPTTRALSITNLFGFLDNKEKKQKIIG
jgi:hypothetical protein